MSNIDKRALREAAEKALPAMKRLLMMPNDELFDEALLNVDGDVDAANAFNLLTGPETALALLDEVEASQSENERLAKALTERNGEPVEGLVKRVAELEEIATDYGMKFQRAQDALKHQSLLHKSQLEAAEKRIAEQREYYEGVIADGSKRIAELEARTINPPEVRITVAESKRKNMTWRELGAYNEGADVAKEKIFKLIRAAGIGKGE